MRLNRSSLRTIPSRLPVACAVVVVLSATTACGGGGAAPPTPTGAASVSASAVPAASPQRPPLASPAASPSVVASTAATPGPGPTSSEAGGQSYEVQSGDTLLSIAQQFYGDNSQWRRIYDANKDTIGADPDKLKVGMKLSIPPKQ